MTYWGTHPSWTSLGGPERAAAMALMEADGKDFNSAKNALGAMLNRAHREKADLGEHVSSRLYQPTIEPTQSASRQCGRQRVAVDDECSREHHCVGQS